MVKFHNTPIRFIPTENTKARLLLEILWDGQDHSSLELMNKLGTDPRSAIQSLKRDWGFWRIHNTGGKQGQYQLDERHLSGVSELDKQARHESELIYKEKSYKQSERESKRKKRAWITLKMTKVKIEADIQLEIDLEK